MILPLIDLSAPVSSRRALSQLRSGAGANDAGGRTISASSLSELTHLSAGSLPRFLFSSLYVLVRWRRCAKPTSPSVEVVEARSCRWPLSWTYIARGGKPDLRGPICFRITNGSLVREMNHMAALRFRIDAGGACPPGAVEIKIYAPPPSRRPHLRREKFSDADEKRTGA